MAKGLNFFEGEGSCFNLVEKIFVTKNELDKMFWKSEIF